MKKFLLAAAVLASAVGAQASIIPTLISGPTPIGSGSFQYDYRATLASDQALRDGAYFTLYDITGFKSASGPTGFMASEQLLGVTPSDVLPSDDPALLNVTFTYHGPDINFSGPLSERKFTGFTIISTTGTVGFEDFTSQAFRNSGPTRGTLVDTIGKNAVAVPGGDGGGTGSTVPEPASWAMMLAGFGMIGAAQRRRSLKRVAA